MCACVRGTRLQSTCVLAVLTLISQPRRLTTDPQKSDYCPGWTGHERIASQTCVQKEGRGLSKVLDES